MSVLSSKYETHSPTEGNFTCNVQTESVAEKIAPSAASQGKK